MASIASGSMIAAQTSAGTALDVHFARYLTPSSKRRDKPRLINEYRIASEALASPARQGPGPNFGGGGNNDLSNSLKHLFHRALVKLSRCASPPL